MSKTPRSRVRACLRQLFLRSRERAQCLKISEYRCNNCNRKQTMKKDNIFKVQVHHKSNINNWDKIIDEIYRDLLNLKDMECLCVDCHKKETEKNGTNRDIDCIKRE
jgi:hypothetical protein